MWRVAINENPDYFMRNVVSIHAVDLYPDASRYLVRRDDGTYTWYQASNGPFDAISEGVERPDTIMFPRDALQALYEELKRRFDHEDLSYRQLKEENGWLRQQLDTALEWQRNIVGRIRPAPKETSSEDS